MTNRIKVLIGNDAADCGMAWRAEIDRRTALEALAAGEGLEVEGFYELTL